MNITHALIRKLPSARNKLICSSSTFKSFLSQKSPGDDSSFSSSSSSSSSESDGTSKTSQKSTNKDAVSKLNILLQQIVQDTDTNKLQLARPTNRRIKPQTQEFVRKEPVEKQVINAVKDVAQSLGGNTKQTESELLMRLLNPVDPSADLSNIIKGMKIERQEKPTGESKAERVRKILQNVGRRTLNHEESSVKRKPKRSVSQGLQQSLTDESIDLFGSEPLGIFTDQSGLKESPQLSTWQKLYEKELKLAVTHPPANYFQEMILWTEQGKFWQFPVNNEFGLEDESKVYFADHVFLEEHLEPWCPTKGPIRHFMELVCVGLSKNPYLTVEAKKEHINWYKNYFEDKKKILLEIGALESKNDDSRNI